MEVANKYAYLESYVNDSLDSQRKIDYNLWSRIYENRRNGGILTGFNSMMYSMFIKDLINEINDKDKSRTDPSRIIFIMDYPYLDKFKECAGMFSDLLKYSTKVVSVKDNVVDTNHFYYAFYDDTYTIRNFLESNNDNDLHIVFLNPDFQWMRKNGRLFKKPNSMTSTVVNWILSTQSSLFYRSGYVNYCLGITLDFTSGFNSKVNLVDFIDKLSNFQFNTDTKFNTDTQMFASLKNNNDRLKLLKEPTSDAIDLIKATIEYIIESLQISKRLNSNFISDVAKVSVKEDFIGDIINDDTYHEQLYSNFLKDDEMLTPQNFLRITQLLTYILEISMIDQNEGVFLIKKYFKSAHREMFDKGTGRYVRLLKDTCMVDAILESCKDYLLSREYKIDRQMKLIVLPDNISLMKTILQRISIVSKSLFGKVDNVHIYHISSFNDIWDSYEYIGLHSNVLYIINESDVKKLLSLNSIRFNEIHTFNLRSIYDPTFQECLHKNLLQLTKRESVVKNYFSETFFKYDVLSGIYEKKFKTYKERLDVTYNEDHDDVYTNQLNIKEIFSILNSNPSTSEKDEKNKTTIYLPSIVIYILGIETYSIKVMEGNEFAYTKLIENINWGSLTDNEIKELKDFVTQSSINYVKFFSILLEFIGGSGHSQFNEIRTKIFTKLAMTYMENDIGRMLTKFKLPFKLDISRIYRKGYLAILSLIELGLSSNIPDLIRLTQQGKKSEVTLLLVESIYKNRNGINKSMEASKELAKEIYDQLKTLKKIEPGKVKKLIDLSDNKKKNAKVQKVKLEKVKDLKVKLKKVDPQYNRNIHNKDANNHFKTNVMTITDVYSRENELFIESLDTLSIKEEVNSKNFRFILKDNSIEFSDYSRGSISPYFTLKFTECNNENIAKENSIKVKCFDKHIEVGHMKDIVFLYNDMKLSFNNFIELLFNVLTFDSNTSSEKTLAKWFLNNLFEANFDLIFQCFAVLKSSSTGRDGVMRELMENGYSHDSATSTSVSMISKAIEAVIQNYIQYSIDS